MVKNNSKWNRFSRASLCYMLATEYLWMSTGECITVCGLLSTCMPHFALTFELSALLHAKQAFYSTLRQPCLLSITSHNPSIILIVYFVNYVTLMISQAVKSCTIAWLPAIKNRCTVPLNSPVHYQQKLCVIQWCVPALDCGINARRSFIKCLALCKYQFICYNIRQWSQICLPIWYSPGAKH